MKISHKISHTLFCFVVIQVSSVVMLQTDAQAQSCDPNVSSELNGRVFVGFNRVNGASHSHLSRGLLNTGSVDIANPVTTLFDLTNNQLIFTVTTPITIPPGMLLRADAYTNNISQDVTIDYEVGITPNDPAIECDLSDNFKAPINYDDTIRGPTVDVNNCDWDDGSFEAIPGLLLPPIGGGDVCDLPPNSNTVILNGVSVPVSKTLSDGRTLSVPVSIAVMVTDETTSYTMAQTTAHY